ncbi:unnamed protein product, partial [Brenthis ino]
MVGSASLGYDFGSGSLVRLSWDVLIDGAVLFKAIPASRWQDVLANNDYRRLEHSKAYLPGVGDTVIKKAVPPERGPSIALRLG